MKNNHILTRYINVTLSIMNFHIIVSFYTLEGGVVGTCGVLCNALAQKTGSQALGAVCDILCDIAGIKEFIKLIEK